MAIIKNTRLTEEEIQDRLALYAESRDVNVRNEIIVQYANLIESIARRFSGAGEPVEDMAQEGYIGLITAVDLFDASKGVKFSTYATHFIIGQIKHYLRDKGKIIKEPAWLQELNQRMTKVMESLSHKHGRQPSEAEIGKVMDLPEKNVRDLLMTREVFKVSSLDAERDESHPNPVDIEKIKDPKIVAFQLPVEDKIVLQTAMDRLKSIEQKVIHEFYFMDLNQTEIARKFGISCNYVSHILRNSTKKLKKILMTEEIKDTQLQLTLMSKRLRSNRDDANQLTIVDSTTGLYNRDYFMSRIEEEISRSFRFNNDVAVVLAEIRMPDEVSAVVQMIRFDDVLSQAADTIVSNVRKIDIVGRYSNSVLSILLPHTGETASTVCQRLLRKLAEITVKCTKGSSGINLELKIGHAVYQSDGTTAQLLIDAAANRAGISSSDLNAVCDPPMRLAA